MIRSFAIWAGRWWATPPRLEMLSSIQPVVIVDDVSGLSLPPVNVRLSFGGFGGTTTAGQLPTVIMTPVRRAFRLLKSRMVCANGATEYQINNYTQSFQASPAGSLSNEDTSSPSFQQGPVDILKQLNDVLVTTGETATARWQEAGGFYASATTHEHNLLVLPGQYLIFQTLVAASSLAVKLLEWEELEADVFQLESSQPRGLRGVG